MNSDRSFSSFSRGLFAICVAALFAACHSNNAATDGGGEGGVTTALPCDVSQVFRDRCQTCHAAQPVAGAPMPLVTYEDTQAPARSDASRTVWQMVDSRIHNAQQPMPPVGQPQLSVAERAVLEGWIAAQAPRGTETQCAVSDAGADAGPPIGPDALPCPSSEQVTYRAHGTTAGSEFHVPADAGNLYMCFTFRSPFATPTHATAFAPIIDDRRVVHHYILYQTATAQTEGGLGPCHMPADATFLTGWAPGAGNTELPSDVGLLLPDSNHYFILQIHYWNTASYTDSDDSSGLAMCVTDQLRMHSAGVSTLGTLNIAVPPRTTPEAPYVTSGSCAPTNTEPVHIVSYGPHMHQHGVSIDTRIFRGGDMTQPGAMMVDVPQWDFQSQGSYPAMADTLVNPGDVLVTTCRYQNPGDQFIYFGERTEDEMCFDFVLAWPVGALVNAAGATTSRCIDRVR